MVTAPQPAPQTAASLGDLGVHQAPPAHRPQLTRPTATSKKRAKKASTTGRWAMLGGGSVVALLLAGVLAVVALNAARDSISRTFGGRGDTDSSSPNANNIAASSFVRGKAPNAQAGSSPTAAAGQSWRRYRSDVGNFQIDLPSNYKASSKTRGLPGVAVSLTTRGAAAEGPDGAYAAQFTSHRSFRDLDYQTWLTNTQRAFQTQFNSSNHVFEEIEMQGLRGMSATLEGAVGGRQAARRARVLLAGDTMYELMWVGAPSAVPSTDELDRFFDSFEILSPRRLNGPSRTGAARNVAGNAPPGLPGRNDIGGRSPSAGPSRGARNRSERAEADRKSAYLAYGQERQRQIDRIASPGGFGSPPPEVINRRKEAAGRFALGKLAGQLGIPYSELESIVSEGDANGWGE